VLAKFERKEFVQIKKYRGATKDGIAMKSEISWRNKKIASQWIQKYREVTKDGITVQT
jgi:hypothetical protein